ncbi:MAG: hypothetical protein ACKVQC_00600 [Elusimicrobiota bacterium]
MRKLFTGILVLGTLVISEGFLSAAESTILDNNDKISGMDLVQEPREDTTPRCIGLEEVVKMINKKETRRKSLASYTKPSKESLKREKFVANYARENGFKNSEEIVAKYNEDCLR